MVLAALGVVLVFAPVLHVPDRVPECRHRPAISSREPGGVTSRDSTVASPSVGVTRSDTTAGSFRPSDASAPFLLAAGFGAPNDLPVLGSAFADTAPHHTRPKAIEYSDFYHTRLVIHQVGSYVILPLFFAEYYMGEKLITSASPPQNLKDAHAIVAGALGVVFIVNTITGGWNWWDSRHDPTGKTRRTWHTVMMLVADAGFVATAASAPGGNHHHTSTNYATTAQTHRAIAIGSISLATISTVMMWVWKN